MLALPPLAGAVAKALGEAPTQPGIWELVASGVIAIVLVVTATRWRPPEPRWAVGWLGLEAAAHWGVVRPTLRIAASLARFDDEHLDRAVDRTASASRAAARWTAAADDRNVDGSVEGIAARIRLAGRRSTRPQSGLLHQYYAQAVAALAAVVVLIVVVGR